MTADDSPRIADPFAPPVAPIAIPTGQDRRPTPWLWGLTFLLNLILPMMLATSVVESTGWLGVAAGVLTLGGLGWLVVTTYPRIAPSAAVGGIIVAASQLLPILQILAGLLAMAVVEKFSLGLLKTPGPDQFNLDRLGPVGAFWATCQTGLTLFLFSLSIGWLVRASWLFIKGTPASSLTPERQIS